MPKMDHSKIAEMLRLAAGEWIVVRVDTPARINSTLGHWRHRARPSVYSDRYAFKMSSDGYGTRRSRLLMKYEPVTLPLNE